MKPIELIYTATWSTTVEVPDDFEITPESIRLWAQKNDHDFDFTDGGADWNLDPIDSYMNSIGFGPCLE